MKLTAENVRAVLMDSLFTPEETGCGTDAVGIPEGAVMVDGVTGPYGFHPKRLQAHLEDVGLMLDELPTEFSAGGGWSFLNMCMTRDGRQWGEHVDVEGLMVLGIGLGLVEMQLPRELWPALPGGMPYLRVKSWRELAAKN
jgi:hypothetical protein